MNINIVAQNSFAVLCLYYLELYAYIVPKEGFLIYISHVIVLV